MPVSITFTVRVTKRHTVDINFLKKSAAHYSGTIGLVVLESYVLVRVRVVKPRDLIHTDRTRTYILFCDKTWVQMLYFLILNRSSDFLLYTKKETSRVLFTIKYSCYHGSWFVIWVRADFTFVFTFRVYAFQKQVRQIKEYM